jgi:hypothetical protein
MIPQAFLEALPAEGPSPELTDADNIFSFLIGSWEIDALLYDANGRVQKTKGEVHASWVLEGRAIQDLFIFPRRALPAQGDRYATTIRTYDRGLKAWRVNFINPAAYETSANLIARRQGDGIEMEGQLADGTPIRWRYEKINPTSFHYSAEKMNARDNSWHLYLELFGKKTV